MKENKERQREQNDEREKEKRGKTTEIDWCDDMELSHVKSNNNENKRKRSNEEIFSLNEVRSDADRLLCSETTPRTNTQRFPFDGERLNATIKHFNAFHSRCSFSLIGNGKKFSITFHAR